MGVRTPLWRVAETMRGMRNLPTAGRSSAGPGSVADAVLELARSGPAPLSGRRPTQGPLRIAAVIPSFRRGSGGHQTIARLLLGMSRMGHEVSVWLEDHEGRHARESAQVTQRSFAAFFAAGELPFHCGLAAWEGADVALATGWQTAPRVMTLPEVGARAYLVQDHEPDFYPASAEAIWAAETYRMGMFCIAASPWLAQLLRERYGAAATHFDLGVDGSVYRPRAVEREDELVVFYARSATPRRAVPLGLVALSELAARRPGVAIELFGEPVREPKQQRRSRAGGFRELGVLDESELANLYSRAAVGVVFSLTNPSLIGLEMMACGLPCVELASASMRASFGSDGPLQLSEPSALEVCAAIERLLDSPADRERISREGVEMTSARSWQGAVGQVESALRQTLAASRA